MRIFINHYRFINFVTKLIGTGVRDSCGKSASRGDTACASRGLTARGKRVPGAEINGQFVKAKRKLAQKSEPV
ncbi:hypothetical protein [Peribacillus aracenensis]|uniref:hypothetical protein n=1 Tax=Peribacillus aracenensis TaxID=2976708 RepID=UPI0021A90EB6|nr:hypothetical protein [Peribacillus sp. BBB004]